MEFRPARLSDYAAMFPGRGQRGFRWAAVQILGGPSWTLWRGDEPVLLCGLWPFAPGVLEAWLMMPRRPPAAALKELLTRTLGVYPEKIIIARIDDTNTAGRRLALLAGFDPLDEHLPGTSIRTWLRRSLLPVA
jgi:hypothetical protein